MRDSKVSGLYLRADTIYCDITYKCNQLFLNFALREKSFKIYEAANVFFLTAKGFGKDEKDIIDSRIVLRRSRFYGRYLISTDDYHHQENENQ